MAQAAELYFSANAKEVVTAINGIQSRLHKLEKEGRRADVGKPMAEGFTSAAGAAGVLRTALAGVGIASFAAGAMKAVGAVKDFTVGIISAAAEMENYNVRFATLLGSNEEAATHLEHLNEYAAETPFEMEGISRASATLLAFGVDAEESMNILKMLGDVAAGTGEDLASLAAIYGKTNTAGRLDYGDVRQLGSRGLNVVKYLAERDKLRPDEVKKAISGGKYGIADLNWVLQQATGKGGLFFNATQNQSKTFSGTLSTLKDNVELNMAEIGDVFLDPAKKTLAELNKLIGDMQPTVVKFFRAIKSGGYLAADALREGYSFLREYAPNFLLTADAVSTFLQPFGEYVRLEKELSDLEAETEKLSKVKIFTSSAEIQQARLQAELTRSMATAEKEAAEAAERRAAAARETRRETILALRQGLSADRSKRAAAADRAAFSGLSSSGMREQLAARFAAATGRRYTGTAADEVALAAAENAAAGKANKAALAEIAAIRDYTDIFKKTQAAEVKANDERTAALDEARAAEVHAWQLHDAQQRGDAAEVQRLQAEQTATSKFKDLLRLGMSPAEAAQYAADAAGREHGGARSAAAGSWLRSDMASVGGGGAARLIPNAQLAVQRQQLSAAQLTNQLLSKLIALPRSTSIPVTP